VAKRKRLLDAIKDRERGTEAERPGRHEPVNGDHDDWQGDHQIHLPGDEPPAPLAPEANEADDDPHRLARLYAARFDGAAGRRQHWWREEWHRWDGAAYQPVPDKEVRAELCQAVKGEFDRLNVVAVERWAAAAAISDKPKAKPTALRVTSRLVGDVQQALTGTTLLPSSAEPPCWLGDGPAPFPAAETIACRNGLIHLPSFAAGRDCRRPPSARFFTLNALDYDFHPSAAPPREWLSFLAALWPDDAAAVGLLQEWFGYCLLPDTSQQKILMCVGPKRSGKGTIARVLTRVVGAANCCAPTLAGLGTNFGLSPLLGKTLAVVSDARLSGRTDTAVVVERLLAISGEDAQTVDRKHLRHVTARLPVRFVILTNELPRLNDPSGALVGRLLVLPMIRSWYGKEDVRLTARLLGELPGILLWALEGWQRLRERGHFVQPDAGVQLVEDLEDLTSPVGAFVRECCEVGAGYEVPVQDLFAQWKRWCEEKGRREPGTEQNFGKDLHAAVPGLGGRRPREGDSRVRTYVGIRARGGEDCAHWPAPGT
jgi:putative DNA primase/helicase